MLGLCCCAGFSLVALSRLLLLLSTGSKAHWLQYLQHVGSVVVTHWLQSTGLVALKHVRASWIRD